MNEEKQIEEINELTDLLSDIGSDWNNYIDECQENEEEPCFSYYDFHAQSLIEQGYRKVIMCKDCKYFYNEGFLQLCRYWNGHATTEWNYCSCAKMKGAE